MQDVGGPCKRCQNVNKTEWHCKEGHGYVEPNGPNYACIDYEPRG